MGFGESEQRGAVEDDLHGARGVRALDAVEAAFPDGEGGGELDFGVAQGDVDARFEGFVDDADAVGGQEEDPGVVF